MFAGNSLFGRQSFFPGVVNRNFGCKVLGFENDCRGKVGERMTVGNFPGRLHGLCRFAEQRAIPFTANDAKVFVGTGVLVDNR